MNSEIDYGTSGLDLRQAKVDHAKRHNGSLGRNNDILWNGMRVKTADWWDVPSDGTIKIEFLSSDLQVDQGVDIKVEDGWLSLSNGDEVPILRTWVDQKYEDFVEYCYFSKAREICVWNVYKMVYPAGQIVEERWTGNAGFWLEHLSDLQRIYHCSHGMNDKPDFESLVFKVTVSPKS